MTRSMGTPRSLLRDLETHHRPCHCLRHLLHGLLDKQAHRRLLTFIYYTNIRNHV
jgi:hypothetical protein